MKKRAFIYLHTSDESLLDTQEKVLEKYCQLNDWEVVKAFTGYEEMLEAIKMNEADIILVDTFERLGKNKNIFASYNVEVASIAEANIKHQ